MRLKMIKTVVAALAMALLQSADFAYGGDGHPQLHVNSKWKECSFQIDPSLTQKDWHQFTQEAGLVVYFRSLTDARPMGYGHFELSALQWKTGIDDVDPAWNNTFVHPDSNHWLFEGNGLQFPGLMFRAGVTDQIDVGAYFTKNPNANYGFWGAQVQYNVVDDVKKNWAASTRASVVSLFGPKDVSFTVFGLDLLASKTYAVFSKWASISPYAGVSTYVTTAHEKSALVNLDDETIMGVQAMLGAVAQISFTRLSLEYNVARVNSISLKIGVSF